MLKIRLQRTGRKHEPTFRVVLTDSKSGPKSGKFLEVLGSYDARDRNETTLKAERITHWISEGAQVSGTVHNLLISKEVIKGKKINVLSKKSPIVDEEKIKAETEAKAKAEEEKARAEAEANAKIEEAKIAAEAPKEETPEEVKEEVVAEAEVKEETPVEEKVEEAPVEVVEEVKEETQA